MTTQTPQEAIESGISVHVSSVEVSDGTTIEFSREGVVFLVGPNNAGKSQFLKDLYEKSRGPETAGRVLRALVVEKAVVGDLDEVLDALVTHHERDGVVFYRVPGWGDVQLHNIVNQWHQPA